jgi:hypothetical protein
MIEVCSRTHRERGLNHFFAGHPHRNQRGFASIRVHPNFECHDAARLGISIGVLEARRI